MKPTPRTLLRVQAGAWGTLLLLCAGILGHAIVLDEDVPFLGRGDGPDWIMAPLPQTADLIAVDPAAPPIHVFSKHFSADEGSSGGRLRGRALRHATARLNGLPLSLEPTGPGWKQGFEADLAGRLRPGRNALEISVANPAGPALLQAELEKPGGTIVSDASWQVVVRPGLPVFAEAAEDVSLHPESQRLPTPLEVPASHAALLVLVFGVGAGLAWQRPARLVRVPATQWPRLTLGAISLFWVVLFGSKFWQLPIGVGFDAPGHLAYIDYLLETGALPTAAYGFATYHPPLFYLMTSTLVALLGGEPGTVWGQIVYRLVPFASGLANVWLTAAVARRIWPGEGLRPSLSIAVAGLLPMNLYMSAYVSNEPLLAAWVSASFALGAAILLTKHPRRLLLVALTFVLGAALLTKFTALAIVPVVAFFVALRVWWLDGRGALPALARFGIIGLGAGAIAGWFYLRNWLLFGDPLIWNLDIPEALSWWMRPGFHTASWYASFGESLAHPLFAGYASFWDGLYSTLWGDGLVAGMAQASTRHGLWNDPFQLLTYPLALPATLALGAGGVGLWVRSFRDENLGTRLVLSMLTVSLFVLAFSLGLISLRLAFYAQAKAFYMLCGVLPLALAGAQGLSAPATWVSASGRRRVAGCAWVGWLASLAACIVLAHLG